MVCFITHIANLESVLLVWDEYELVWDEYAYCQIFDIVQCDERRHDTVEDFASYFSDTLFKRAI